MKAIALLTTLLLTSPAIAECLPPPPPATPTHLYYTEIDRAAYDTALIAIVAGTATTPLYANDLAYRLVQLRRWIFVAPPQVGSPINTTPWTADDRRMFAAIAASALDGQGGPTRIQNPTTDIITGKANGGARQVMDFQKTWLSGPCP